MDGRVRGWGIGRAGVAREFVVGSSDVAKASHAARPSDWEWLDKNKCGLVGGAGYLVAVVWLVDQAVGEPVVQQLCQLRVVGHILSMLPEGCGSAATPPGLSFSHARCLPTRAPRGHRLPQHSCLQGPAHCDANSTEPRQLQLQRRRLPRCPPLGAPPTSPGMLSMDFF